jgi:hypothetical protein
MEAGSKLLDTDAQRRFFSRCESVLITCPSCGSLASSFDIPLAYPWAHRLFCHDKSCQDNWLICRMCKGVRQRLPLQVVKVINRHRIGCESKMSQHPDTEGVYCFSLEEEQGTSSGFGDEEKEIEDTMEIGTEVRS